ncbi:unnamed protein product [Camellia sinensis]
MKPGLVPLMCTIFWNANMLAMMESKLAALSSPAAKTCNWVCQLFLLRRVLVDKQFGC